MMSQSLSDPVPDPDAKLDRLAAFEAETFQLKLEACEAELARLKAEFRLKGESPELHARADELIRMIGALNKALAEAPAGRVQLA